MSQEFDGERASRSNPKRIRSPGFLKPYLEPCAKMIHAEISERGISNSHDRFHTHSRRRSRAAPAARGGGDALRPHGNRRRWRRGGVSRCSTAPTRPRRRRGHPRSGHAGPRRHRRAEGDARARHRRARSSSRPRRAASKPWCRRCAHGAFDFVVKPASPDRLQAAIANALKVEAVEGEVKRTSRERGGHADLQGHDHRTAPAMDRVIRLGQKAAASNIPILIEGESGVGKELVARAIQGTGDPPLEAVRHRQLRRHPRQSGRDASCSATRRAPSPAPPKSMPASSSRRIRARCSSTRSATCRSTSRSSCCAPCRRARSIRSAAGRPVRVDIRLISATHRNLLQQVKDGKFREDLFYRLNVYPDLRAAAARPPRRHPRSGPALHGEGRARRAAPAPARHFGAERSPCCRPMTGLAICASSRTPSSGRSVLCEGDVLTVDDFPQIRAQVEGIVTASASGCTPRTAGAGAGPARRLTSGWRARQATAAGLRRQAAASFRHSAGARRARQCARRSPKSNSK